MERATQRTVAPRAAAEGGRESPAPDARELGAAYVGRTRAELRELADRGILTSGSAFPSVLFVKGRAGAAELAGSGLLEGEDGVALRSALGRLGYEDDAWAGLATWMPDRTQASAEDVAWAVEVLDPESVVALDTPAAQALERAWGLDYPLRPGTVHRVLGRRVCALGGFETALSDQQAKRVMWARLKELPPLAAPM